uniref:protein FAM83A n=1 Tax=Centroberyx gerrardi TaxID=166262 RepID=UPI003AAEB7B6
MDANGLSVLWYMRSKPVGKVRRRVQDLRSPSSSFYSDPLASKSAPDLSHNESVRLAADSLLSQGLVGYQEVLNAEGEVDFLSEQEKNYILANSRDGNTGCMFLSTDSDPSVQGLDLGSLNGVERRDPALAQPSVEVYFQSDSRAASVKDLVREFIRKASTALAIVMDTFSDVELLCDLLEASRKRNVSVHLLLDHLNLNLFLSMWQELNLNSKHFPKLSVRSVDGQTYCAKTGKKLTGQITERFIITDWNEVLTGSYSFSWLSWQIHRGLAVLFKGSTVTPFHQEFQRLYTSSKPVPAFFPGPHHPPPPPHPLTSHTVQKDPSGLGTNLYLQPHTSRPFTPPPRLHWMPQRHAAGLTPVVRQRSFSTAYGTGQKAGGQLGCRPFQSSMMMSL